MLRVFTLLSLLATQTFAQAAPPRRAHHSLIYDPAGNRVLLWGGSTPNPDGRSGVYLNDLWSFDGEKWTALGETGLKSSGAPLAFDSRRNRILSFGGHAGQSLGDVRTLDGATWKTLGQHPELRVAEPGFVYDAHRDRFVAFGGSSGPGSASGETWEFDGTTWQKINTAGPGPRQAHVMVYDTKRNRIVLFGGLGTAPRGQQPPAFGDTWEFDGSTWTRRDVTGPEPRFSAGATFDSKRGVVVIFGGLGAGDGFFGDTWSWDGTTWRKLASSGPEARAMGYLAYDIRRDRTVLFGGRKGWPDGDLNDTWEWNGSTWSRVGR